MHPTSILNSIFRSSLTKLQDYYEQLSRLSVAERDRVVLEANASLASINAAILHDDTTKAKKVLLQFKYLTRLAFCLPDGFDDWLIPKYYSRTRFVEQLMSFRSAPNPKHDWDKIDWKISGWSHGEAPSQSEFTDLIWPHFLNDKFSSQADLLCDELFGLPFPSQSESITEWMERAELVENAWAKCYAGWIIAEKARWFPSKKKLQAIELLREKHRAQIVACLKELEPIFPALWPSKERIETLKTQEPKIWLHCNYINRVSAAIMQGVQLKHLLLEDAHNSAKIKLAFRY